MRCYKRILRLLITHGIFLWDIINFVSFLRFSDILEKNQLGGFIMAQTKNLEWRLLDLVKPLRALQKEIKVIEREMEDIENEGVLQGTSFFVRKKYFCIRSPMIDGHRPILYIGNDEEKVESAKQQLKNGKKWNKKLGVLSGLNGQLSMMEGEISNMEYAVR